MTPIDSWLLGLAGFLAVVLVELVTRRLEVEGWQELCDAVTGQRDEWKHLFVVANAQDHEAIAADRAIERALGREEALRLGTHCKWKSDNGIEFLTTCGEAFRMQHEPDSWWRCKFCAQPFIIIGPGVKD